MLSHYESIRYINSSLGAYLVAIYFIEKIRISNFKFKIFIIIFFSSIYTYEVINYLNKIKLYQLSSHNHRTFPYKYDVTDYKQTEFNFFGQKKLRHDYVEYYSDIINIICSKKIFIILVMIKHSISYALKKIPLNIIYLLKT